MMMVEWLALLMLLLMLLLLLLSYPMFPSVVLNEQLFGMLL